MPVETVPIAAFMGDRSTPAHAPAASTRGNTFQISHGMKAAIKTTVQP